MQAIRIKNSLFWFISLFLVSVIACILLSNRPTYSLASDFGVNFVNGNPVLSANDIEIKWIHAAQLELTFKAKPDNKVIFTPVGSIGDGYIEQALYDRLGEDEGKIYFYAKGYNECGTGLDGGTFMYIDFNEDGGRYDALSKEFTDIGVFSMKFLETTSADCKAVVLGGVPTIDPQMSTAWFAWASETQIVAVEGLSQGLFTQDESSPNYFVRASEASVVCKDKLLLDTSKSPNTVLFFELDDDFGGINFPPPPEAKAGSGCEMRGVVSGVPTSNVPWRVAGTPTAPVDAGLEGSIANDESCEAEGGSFSFVICPLLNFADGAITALDNRIFKALLVEEDTYGSPALRQSWGRIRNISYIILIPIMLVMVISTALGFSFVDAYTVKRALPRLFLAVIFMALSFDLCIFMINVVNGLGQGVSGLIAQPFNGLENLQLTDLFNPNGINDGLVVAGGIAFVAVGFVGIGIIASYMAVGALVLLLVFILLALRRVLLIALIMLAPFAIIAWIFPGNDKLWKLWWGSFSKLLYLFPIIMILLVSGRVFAKIVDTGDGGLFETIIKLTAFIAPYFLIPAAFKFAGGAFANIAGMVDSKGKGFMNSQKKYRGEKRKSTRDKRLENLQNSNLFNGADPHSRRGWVNSKLGSLANAKSIGYKGLAPTAQGKAIRAARIQGAKNDRELGHMKHMDEDQVLQRMLANDDFAEAVIHGKGNEAAMAKFLQDEKGMSAEASVAAASTLYKKRKEYGIGSMGAAAVIAKAGSKTSYTGGQGELLADVAAMSEGDSVMANTIMAAARGRAGQAGRWDLSDGSHGEAAAGLSAIMNADSPETRLQAVEETNIRMGQKVMEGKSAYQLGQVHPSGAKVLVAGMQLTAQEAVGKYHESTGVALSAQRAMETAQVNYNANPSAATEAWLKTTTDAHKQAQANQTTAKIKMAQSAAEIHNLQQAAPHMGSEVGRVFAEGLSQSVSMASGATTDGAVPFVQTTLGDFQSQISQSRDEQLKAAYLSRTMPDYNAMTQEERQRMLNP